MPLYSVFLIPGLIYCLQPLASPHSKDLLGLESYSHQSENNCVCIFHIGFCAFFGTERIPPESDLLQMHSRLLASEPCSLSALFSEELPLEAPPQSTLKCGVGLFFLNHIKEHRLFPLWEQNALMTRKNKKRSGQPALSGEIPGTPALTKELCLRSLFEI